MVAIAKSGGAGLLSDADLALGTTWGQGYPREEPVGQYNKIGPFVAGEALAAGDLVYINSSGLVARSNGTSANAAAKVDGCVITSYSSGETGVFIYFNVVIHWASSGLTPGARYFVDTSAGGLSTVATTGGTAAVAMAVSATDVFVWQSRY